MRDRRLPSSLTFALPLLLLTLTPGCENKSSPTEPPPNGGPTITASSGAAVALAGTWRSRCFGAPQGSLVVSAQETFTITAEEIVISIVGFLAANCSGVTVTEELTVDYTLGAEATAKLIDAVVGVTRVDGTVLSSSDAFRQIFHIDDSGVHLLYHGVLEGGQTDADGYPTELFEEPLERQ